MTDTIESLQAQRTALKSAMRSGALMVRHGDKSVQYRSLEEMRDALEDLDEDIADLTGAAKPKRVFYIGAGRGY